jgi:hypothetical protein
MGDAKHDVLCNYDPEKGFEPSCAAVSTNLSDSNAREAARVIRPHGRRFAGERPVSPLAASCRLTGP